MAKIEKRGELQWRTLVRREGYPAYSRTFDDERSAKSWGRQLETAMDLKDLAEVRRLTGRGEELGGTVAALVGEYRRLVLPSVGASKTSEATRLKRIEERFGRLVLAMLTTADVNKWRMERLAEGASPGTVRHDMNMLSKLLQFGINELGLEGARNVVRDAKKPPIAKGRDRRTSDLEFHYLLRAATEVPEGRPDEAPARGLGPLFTLALATGARLGELNGLTWREVDLKKAEMLLKDTKNGDSRTVPLSDVALGAFAQLKAVTRIDGKVFDWARSDSASKPIKRAVERAKALHLADATARGEKPASGFLENFRGLHDLRHECASRLMEAGFNIVDVAFVLGHRSPQMSLRYAHHGKVNDMRTRMNAMAAPNGQVQAG